MSEYISGTKGQKGGLLGWPRAHGVSIGKPRAEAKVMCRY